MKETILRGLEQAYSNLVQMGAVFLPRFLVMLIIIALGLRCCIRAQVHFAGGSGPH